MAGGRLDRSSPTQGWSEEAECTEGVIVARGRHGYKVRSIALVAGCPCWNASWLIS